MTPPDLVLAVGNPSRGDDALGPAFAQHLEASFGPEIAAGQLEVLTDFQLNVEHSLDLLGRHRVVFVDATLESAAPFTFSPVTPRADHTFTSHALSPSAVLEAWHRVERGPPPSCFQLALRGTRFELGEPLTPQARDTLQQAARFFDAWWSGRAAPQIA
ncbi:MAG: hydrogenase maturation protease [Myxococcales bacterium]|nr:hydrogenase maturation protease [Myxococcales bacterium]